MKKVILTLLIGLYHLGYAEQATPESIKKLLHLTGQIKYHQETLSTYYLPMLQKNMPNADGDFVKQALQAEFDNDSFVNQLIPDYQASFTQADIDAYLTFFQTAAGKKYLAKAPELALSKEIQSELWLKQAIQNIHIKYNDKYGN